LSLSVLPALRRFTFPHYSRHPVETNPQNSRRRAHYPRP
jgi:hypothetical protein